MLAIRRAAVRTQRKRSALWTPFQTATLTCDAWRERERAEETAYFNKMNEKALRRLVKKMKAQATESKPKNPWDTQGLERLKHLDLTPEQVDALLEPPTQKR